MANNDKLIDETSSPSSFQFNIPHLSMMMPSSDSNTDSNFLGSSPDDFSNVLSILDSAEDVIGGGLGGASFLEPTPLAPGGIQGLANEVQVAPSDYLKENSLLADLLHPLLRDPSSSNSVAEPPFKKQRHNDTILMEASSRRFRSYQSDQWSDRFQELKEYQQKHGDCLVPHCFPENQRLAQWVKRQRYQYKLKKMNRNSTLTDEREAALEEVGFVWDSHKASWSERFQSLLKFVSEHGHTNVPSNFEDKTLAIWIKCQRRQYKLYVRGEKSTITAERIEMMNSLGFIWNPRNL
eukprot:Nitzschia sp. Nitz4//scaffold169_size48518//35652//36533//NITZ4_007078-RA/size48518-processed-gene-0.96-mRNA-1//-1//CDS//3329538406//7524//frame0